MSNKYHNDKDVSIEAHTDKRGRDHISFYDSDPETDHSSIHVNWDSDSGNGQIVDTTGDGKETTDIGCFLTTACMRHMSENFDDNCEELTTLRNFRDTYVSQEDKDHYYKTAPLVVSALESVPDNDKVYDYIYTNVVSACVDAIKQGDYEFAYNRYKNSVIILEEQFVKPQLTKNLTKVLKLNPNN